MTLVPALLRAIAQVDGGALVLHCGQRPYVTSESGRIDLSTSGMTPDAIAGLIQHLLPADSRRVLSESGNAQHELAGLPDFPGERFDVSATTTGEGLSLEIHRHGPLPGDQESRASTTTLDAPVFPGAERRERDIDPPNASAAGPDVLDRVLRAALAEGATALYLVSGSRPWVRLDDDVRVLEGGITLKPPELEAMLTRTPAGGAMAAGAPCQWIWEFPDLGPVRCSSFRDQGGQGLVLRPVPAQPLTSHQLGLGPELEALTSRAQGLIVVAGPRSSDRRAVIAALVDLINRTRRVHVVTVEREMSVVHERHWSFVSQREAGRGLDRMLDVARSALREEPDVLTIETIQRADLVLLALEAASSGRLVIGGFPGLSAGAVLEDMRGLVPPQQRQAVNVALAKTLLGVVVQPDTVRAGAEAGDGRELLLNTPDVACLIGEGKMAAISAPRMVRAPQP